MRKVLLRISLVVVLVALAMGAAFVVKIWDENAPVTAEKFRQEDPYWDDLPHEVKEAHLLTGKIAENKARCTEFSYVFDEIVRTGSSNLTFLAERHLFPFFSPLSGLKHLLQLINSL